MLAGLLAAGVAGGWLAHQRIASAVEGALRDTVSSLSTTLAAGVQFDLMRRAEAGGADGLTDADAQRLHELPLQDGAVVWITGPQGAPLGEAAPGAVRDVCVPARSAGMAATRTHAAEDVPHLEMGGATVLCGVAPINGVGPEPKGFVVVHRPLTDTPIAAILARDIGILTGSMVAVAVGLVLIGIQSLSGWIRRLQAAADRHERNEATANAAGTVLVRLVPHLAYEAETDDRVVDLMQTVDVISGRAGTGAKRPINLTALLGECLDRRERDVRSRDRELRRALQADVWVLGEPDRIALAIDHGMRNAIDALQDDPGRIEVGLVAGRYTVELTIRDTGAEVPRSNRHRLFDTGYSTKEGRPGLGLALVRRVAVDHDGHVELRHPWGGGTTLRIVLPRAKRPKHADAMNALAPPPSAAPTIDDEFSQIVVDDLLGDETDADIPSPPTSIRERTGAEKIVPPDLMGAETLVLESEEKPELELGDEPEAPPAPSEPEDPEQVAEDEMRDFFGV